MVLIIEFFLFFFYVFFMKFFFYNNNNNNIITYNLRAEYVQTLTQCMSCMSVCLKWFQHRKLFQDKKKCSIYARMFSMKQEKNKKETCPHTMLTHTIHDSQRISLFISPINLVNSALSNSSASTSCKLELLIVFVCALSTLFPFFNLASFVTGD